MGEPRKGKRKPRYQKMKRVAKRFEKQENKPPLLTTKDLLKEWWGHAVVILKSKIFKRTVYLAVSFALMIGGLLQIQHHRGVKAQELAMNVSPSNEPTQFALSGTPVTFKPQFISGDTYIVPFEIQGLENLSLNPEDYLVQLQGTNLTSDLNMESRLVLFGTSGRGLILMDGEYTGEPMNIYLLSTNSLTGSSGERSVVTNDDITQMQAEQGNLIINDVNNPDPTVDVPDDVPTGTITIGGQTLTVAMDMVATRLNPTADNVTPTYRDVGIDSTHAELYDVTFGAVDRSAIMTNRNSAIEQRDGVLADIEEYSERLRDDPNVSDEDEKLILEANALAIDSLGDAPTNKKIEDLLAKTSTHTEEEASESTEDNVPLSEMSESERREYLEGQINSENLSISQETSTTQALDQLRITIADLNYQVALYDTELGYIDEVSSQQDDMGRSAVRYEIMSPFD